MSQTPPPSTASHDSLNPSVVVPVVSLTADQSSALQTAGPVELRDHCGKTLGFFVMHPNIMLFYSPDQLAELRRRAAVGTPGRTLSEILSTARARAGA